MAKKKGLEVMSKKKTKSSMTRYWLTNDLVAFLIIVANIAFIYLGIGTPNHFKVGFIVSISWLFGTDIYKEYKNVGT